MNGCKRKLSDDPDDESPFVFLLSWEMPLEYHDRGWKNYFFQGCRVDAFIIYA